MHTRHEIIRKINEFFGTANSIIYTTYVKRYLGEILIRPYGKE